MIKVTDFIAKYLVANGISDVFMIVGGGAMHLNDSFGKQAGMRFICNHHEQASSVAAEGYFRASGKMCVVCVTTGPGGTNTLTGVLGQWLDSVPVLYISGQVKFETMALSCPDIDLRQLGDQEAPITDIVRPITKYSAVVLDPLDIRRQLDIAINNAKHGRPGPVWLDIPMNVQGAMIDENDLYPTPELNLAEAFEKDKVGAQIELVIALLKDSKRPVVIAGHGIRIADAQQEFLNLLKKLKVPIVSTFNGADIIPTEHQLHIGRIGTVGSRAGNFALQNSDLVISIGSRNNIRQVSYNWKTYVRAAKRVVVDIDRAELSKPTFLPDLAIHCDAKYFLDGLEKKIGDKLEFSKWLEWCQDLKKKYPPVLQENKERIGKVDLYYFIDVLTSLLGDNSVVVAGNGSACVGLFQASNVKNGQRIFWNSGCASMGYDLPAAIGACIADDKKEIVCLAGDGSFQMNIQELQTIRHYNLPIKIFYLDNNGYVSIKQTNDAFFGGRRTGCDCQTGVSFPNIINVSMAYGIPSMEIVDQNDLATKIENVLKMPGPVICNVKLPEEYVFCPKLSSEKLPDGRMVSKPLEDLYPFLDRGEFKKNMIIPEWENI